MYTHFLFDLFSGVRKLAAAREVLNKLPLDSIEYIIQSSGGKVSITNERSLASVVR